jgi:hypothetical protein
MKKPSKKTDYNFNLKIKLIFNILHSSKFDYIIVYLLDLFNAKINSPAYNLYIPSGLFK